jgi:hypothetical protein
MTISLERIALLLDVASKAAQWPKLNGIVGKANEELEEANAEALKSLEERAKERAEKEAKEAAEKKSSGEEDERRTASARRI